MTTSAGKKPVAVETEHLAVFQPHWIIRHGNGIFALIIAAMLILAWTIRYPEITRGVVRLVAIDSSLTPGYYGQMWLPQKALNKLRPGAQVFLTLDGYPSAASGQLKGRVACILNQPPVHDSFLAKIDFPDGLTIGSNRSIALHKGLAIGATVLTGRKRLLKIFLDQLQIGVR